MSAALRTNRKASDEDIIRLNSVGLSLATIANELNCHPTTITLRLKALGIEPADTRRSIRDYIKNLLVERFIDSPGDQNDLSLARRQPNESASRDKALPRI
jgi:hypothetical protein